MTRYLTLLLLHLLFSHLPMYLVVAQPVKHYGRCQNVVHGNFGLCRHLDECEFLTDEEKQNSLYACSNEKTNLVCCPTTESLNKLITAIFAEPLETTKKENTPLLEPPNCGAMLSDRIYGGNITNIDEFPWMALIETYTGGSSNFFCGGTLISNRWVLTAAHCVTGVQYTLKNWRIISVRLGEWNTDTSPDCILDKFNRMDCAPAHIDVPVDRVIPHSQYNPEARNYPNDIALLRLNNVVPITAFVTPICLPLDSDIISSNMMLAIAGWGRTENLNQVSSIKLKASLNIWNSDDCRSRLRSHNILMDEGQLCARGAVGVSSCRGDSGGPVMVARNVARHSIYYLVGVISLGSKACTTNELPSLYTRVSAYIPWIREKINELPKENDDYVIIR